jgi:hypothetical protein
MKIDLQTQAFIDGSQFSNGEKIRNVEKYPEASRTELLKSISSGKDIIHIGCLDHVELIEEKRKKNIWLHQLLMDSAKNCIGIDINEAGIQQVKDQYNIKDIYFADIIKEPFPEITSRKWDYIILGEILEHTDNPVLFLNRIKELYKKNIDKIIITVPNVLNFETFRHLKTNTEFINTDHRYWFTAYTILKVINQANLGKPVLLYCNRIPLNNYQLTVRKLRKILLHKSSKYPFPYFSTLLIECKL